KLCLLNDGKGVCGLPGSTYPESAGRWCPSTEVHEPSLAADHTFDITTDSGASDAFFDAASDELIYRDDTDTWFKKHGQVFRPMTYVQVQGEAKQFMQLQVARRFSRSDTFTPKQEQDRQSAHSVPSPFPH